MRVFITGTAGFIGFHLARRLLAEGHQVVGYDAVTTYYDVALKRARLAQLARISNQFEPVEARIEDADALYSAARAASPDVIVHLAAQVGVRYSIENPRSYVESNLHGSFNVLEVARELAPQHLLLASTSSVYGANALVPYRESEKTSSPITLYAATKSGMEVMSHSYSHLWQIPTTCFRFFTVYGPWGRPDMALFKFVRAIRDGTPIDVFGHGDMRRDFTYIDDLIEAVRRLVDCPPMMGQPVQAPDVSDTLSSVAPWRVVNIGGGQPSGLMDLIHTVEECLGRKAILNLLPMQPGDMTQTFADYRLLEAMTAFRPSVSLKEGVGQFVDWFLSQYPATAPA